MAFLQASLGNLTEILLRVKGATVVSLVTETDPVLVKPKSNPLSGRLKKESYVNGMIGWNYQNSVNNQLAREGQEADFVAHPRKWGERIKGTPLVRHNGKVYLELKVEKVFNTRYLLDGVEVSRESIAKYLPAHKPDDSGRQGTDKAVILRDYNLDNVKQLRIGGYVHQFD